MATDPLEPPDSHHCSAAIGWLELGNLPEADAELAKVSPALQGHPAVLELRWLLCAERKDWETAQRVADELIAIAPDQPSGWLHRAYAARRAPGGGVNMAWDLLRPAADRFPQEAVIPFNLACYACQQQQPEEARHWLRRAFQAGGKSQIKAMALADEDLRSLWSEIEKM